jgi:adenosine deaminase
MIRNKTLQLHSFFPLFSSYIYALCNDLQSLIYTTNSVLHDFQVDGVVYLELRTTPRAMPSANVSKELYIETILDCLEKCNSSNVMKTNLILSIDRRNDIATAMSVVDLAVTYRSRGVVGIDLCGDPAVGDISIFTPAFEAAKSNGLKMTMYVSFLSEVHPRYYQSHLTYIFSRTNYASPNTG